MQKKDKKLKTDRYIGIRKLASVIDEKKKERYIKFYHYVREEIIADIKRKRAILKEEIDYIYKTNGGKHTALNYAFENIDTELTIIVDSDDFLKPLAIETVRNDFAKILRGGTRYWYSCISQRISERGGNRRGV